MFLELVCVCVYPKICTVNNLPLLSSFSPFLPRLSFPLPTPDNPENYRLYVEGAALTTIREGDLGTDSSQSRMTRSTSLAHLVDNQSLPGGRSLRSTEFLPLSLQLCILTSPSSIILPLHPPFTSPL